MKEHETYRCKQRASGGYEDTRRSVFHLVLIRQLADPSGCLSVDSSSLSGIPCDHVYVSDTAVSYGMPPESGQSRTNS